jgi:tyrosyl-tRNA synthetase
MNLLEEYRWRGMLQDSTQGADEALGKGPVKAYIGFDPTASSLHVGSLMPIMGLVHLQRMGHSPLVLLGGQTGLVGDPSGKIEERPVLPKDQVEENLSGIRGQLEHFLDFDSSVNPAQTVNNATWLADLQMVDFLRDVGKYFSVTSLLNKESIRRRVKDQDTGISFAEFSYVLLQAYDFLALNEKYGCTFQMGGSDQWGNITAGIQLIRKARNKKAYGITYPLVTGPEGNKFGKTETGTTWLDPKRTSPYRFYQFWMNVDDSLVIDYLKQFTLLEAKVIQDLRSVHNERPHERMPHRKLAEEITSLVHGQDGLSKARIATEVLFGGELGGLRADEIEDVFSDVPSSEMSESDLSDEGLSILDVVTNAGLTQSRSEARRAIEGGGLYLNNIRVTDIESRLEAGNAADGRFFVLRKGKKNYHLIRLLH